MMSGTTRAAVAGKVFRIADLSGGRRRRHDVLLSTRILKKTGRRIAP